MLRALRITGDKVVLGVIGRLRPDDAEELAAELARGDDGRAIVLDLKELILVDRPAVDFLRACESRGVELRRCPGYVRAWIADGAIAARSAWSRRER